MCFKNIHSYFPFRRLFYLLLGIAFAVQILVITYNHFSGYYPIHNFQHLLLRFARGTVLSLAGGFLIAYPDLYVIRYLNEMVPWGKRIFMRICLQAGFAISVAILASTAITLLANWMTPYSEELSEVLIYNAMMYAGVNILLMSILEGWVYYTDSRYSREMAENLQEELSQIKFEVLKSQINPHFMFNSLNVLSGLITVDTARAQTFIDEFSQIYRYVLETIEQPVVLLRDELEFLRSYLYLQQIRYGENLTYTIDIPASLLTMAVPPLTLQVLLENAIKHNVVNESRPLKIEISGEKDSLIVKNNIQPKVSGASTGLGLKNLARRYALVSRLAPSFRVVNNCYIAEVPLIRIEQHESTDN